MLAVGRVVERVIAAVVWQTDSDERAFSGNAMNFLQYLGHVLKMLQNILEDNQIERARLERVGELIQVVNHIGT